MCHTGGKLGEMTTTYLAVTGCAALKKHKLKTTKTMNFEYTKSYLCTAVS